MSSSMKTITLIIRNMTCVNCENVIEQKLSQTDGVKYVKASYSTGKAAVTYDEAVISLERIIEILAKHDYNAALQKEGGIAEAGVGSEAKAAQPAEGKTDFTNIIAVAIILYALYMMANRLGLLNIFNSFPVAKEGMGYGMLFIIGLLTSVHCVAMCGGICLSQCARAGEGKLMAVRPSLLYNLGRIISYTVIGGTVGAVGSVISFSGPMKGVVQLLAGIFMVIMGLNMLNVFPWLRRLNLRMPKIFAKRIYAHTNAGSGNSPFYIGLLNGLMPCGPLQAMQLYALSTGSPVKGAAAMFLFSIGTVPLMFIFGALGSLLNKRLTGKMMTVSAALVIILGMFMFKSGLGLSGVTFPSFTLFTSQASLKTGQVAGIENGLQVVATDLSPGSYEPIVVQKGIPLKWVIRAEDADINGCNNSIIIPKYNIQKKLAAGDNVIEFTPTESGEVPFSCWMGMIRSRITVVDDLNSIAADTITDSAGVGSAGGSCCAPGGAGVPSCH